MNKNKNIEKLISDIEIILVMNRNKKRMNLISDTGII